jgi:hypothetical protein
MGLYCNYNYSYRVIFDIKILISIASNDENNNYDTYRF